jgi:hypothetical protein
MRIQALMLATLFLVQSQAVLAARPHDETIRDLQQALATERAARVAADMTNACWGQATKVFARMGEMGAHASTFDTPRLGLRNLARALAEQGIIPDDSLHALGAFVAAELGLEVEACL